MRAAPRPAAPARCAPRPRRNAGGPGMGLREPAGASGIPGSRQGRHGQPGQVCRAAASRRAEGRRDSAWCPQHLRRSGAAHPARTPAAVPEGAGCARKARSPLAPAPGPPRYRTGLRNWSLLDTLVEAKSRAEWVELGGLIVRQGQCPFMLLYPTEFV